jgi:hypothetical protein
LADDLRLKQGLLDAFLDADEVLPVVFLSGDQLTKAVISILGSVGQLLPLVEGCSCLHDAAQLLTDGCLVLHIFSNKSLLLSALDEYG